MDDGWGEFYGAGGVVGDALDTAFPLTGFWFADGCDVFLGIECENFTPVAVEWAVVDRVENRGAPGRIRVCQSDLEQVVGNRVGAFGKRDERGGENVALWGGRSWVGRVAAGAAGAGDVVGAGDLDWCVVVVPDPIVLGGVFDYAAGEA